MHSPDPWTCRFCGSENDGGESCLYCGALRPEGKLKRKPKPKRKRKAKRLPGDVFLLNPDNERYLSGRSKKPGGPFTGCFVLFMIPFVFAGLFIIGWAINEWNDWRILSSSGVTTQGKVIDRRTETDEGSRDYYVTYRFSHNDTIYTREQSVSHKFYDNSWRDSSVTVLYSPDNPQTSRLGDSISPPILITLFVMLWNGLVSLFMFIAISEARKARYLARRGQVIYGVIASRRGYEDSDRDFHIEVNYEFVSPQTGGIMREQVDRTRYDLDEYTLPSAGTPVAVLYANDKNFTLL
jgi:hypothetical protein